MARILIIDDEPYIRLLYSQELAEDGHETAAEADGYNLLEKIERFNPDLVILDVKMAGYNGLDLLLTIRNNYYELPVILCTAYSIYKQDPKSLAANYYVTKSFDLSDLREKVAMALESVRPSYICFPQSLRSSLSSAEMQN